jgi:hypothetical protein
MTELRQTPSDGGRRQDIAPREASVWFQMGCIYKRL